MKVALSALVLATLASLVACEGYSEERAKKFCDQEQEARGDSACFSAAVYDDCVAAFEECGDDVDVDDLACSPTYTCP